PQQAIGRYERELFTYMRTEQPELLQKLAQGGELTDEIRQELDTALKAFGETFNPEEIET
ncbi:MAG: hypothetical protein ACLFV4_14060, partial [Candidatus Hydrogenedentota bacterium]